MCAVDIGTGSARAGIVRADGQQLARESVPFELVEGPQARHRSFHFADIVDAVSGAVRSALRSAAVAPDAVVGLAVAATCSLVLRDRQARPLRPDEGEGDVLAWCDHRAGAEAMACSRSRHPLVARNGGGVSPEMQTPKLLWLKRQRPEQWQQLGLALDLGDALVLEFTGQASRSLCSLVTKWPYEAARGWSGDYLAELGLDDLPSRVGAHLPVQAPGELAGRLAATAARRLGLPAGLPVATALVDAFAGALGACALTGPGAAGNHLSLVTGTSNAILSLGRSPVRVAGFWGPYPEVIAPGHWVTEAGQSTAGALLDHLLALWTPLPDGRTVSHATVLERLRTLLADEGPALGQDIHLLPDFAGNRSPLADPQARGVIVGLPLERGLDVLCRVYWRAAVALALGLRQLLEHAGEVWSHPEIAVMGGLSREDLLAQLFADATGRRLIRSEEADPVIAGTTALALRAAGESRALVGIARGLVTTTRVFDPDPASRDWIARDYRIFQQLQAQQTLIRGLD